MIPRNLYLEQINRFYDILEKVDHRIALEKDKSDPDIELLDELTLKYSILTTKVWIKLDNIEEVRELLDNL